MSRLSKFKVARGIDREVEGARSPSNGLEILLTRTKASAGVRRTPALFIAASGGIRQLSFLVAQDAIAANNGVTSILRGPLKSAQADSAGA